MINELKSRIDALMSENETVKNNAIKASAVSTSPEMCIRAWSNAKNDNAIYQNVLNIIKEIEDGTVQEETNG